RLVGDLDPCGHHHRLCAAEVEELHPHITDRLGHVDDGLLDVQLHHAAALPAADEVHGPHPDRRRRPGDQLHPSPDPRVPARHRAWLAAHLPAGDPVRVTGLRHHPLCVRVLGGAVHRETALGVAHLPLPQAVLRGRAAMRRWILMALVALLGAAAMTGLRTHSVSAHGETAQEGFVRMEALGWWDVKFSKSDLTQNDNMTVSGTAKILETWPSNMSDGSPKICYFTVVEPGARFVLVDRKINGMPAPQSFFCSKGSVYNFSMTLRARDPGNWHVHPALAVKESGTLIGPGQYVNISSSPSGFSFPLTLLNGKTID